MSRDLFQYHPIFGYHFVPNLRARIEHEGGGYLVRANEAGFRSEREFVRERSGKRRILLFGDSYTAGDGVSNRDRYGDQLEKLLPDVEVYNFGLSGTGTDQQYLVWKEIGRHYEADLLVLGVLVENIRRVAARYREAADEKGRTRLLAKPYFSRSATGELTLFQVPVPKEPLDPNTLPESEHRHVDTGGEHAFLRRLVNGLGPKVKEHAQRLTGYQPLPAYDSPTSQDWLLMKAILDQWTREADIPVVICPIPVYQYVEGTADSEAYRARFRELHAPPKVVVHDPLDAFMSYSSSERRKFRFENDCHLTPSAHRVLADSLSRTIAPLLKGMGV